MGLRTQPFIDWHLIGQAVAASSAVSVRSGTGGKDAEKPHKLVAKIVPAHRETVGCNSPHWVLLKAHQEGLGASEPLGL